MAKNGFSISNRRAVETLTASRTLTEKIAVRFLKSKAREVNYLSAQFRRGTIRMELPF